MRTTLDPARVDDRPGAASCVDGPAREARRGRADRAGSTDHALNTRAGQNLMSGYAFAPPSRRGGSAVALFALGAALFFVLVTANSAGYRYGVSDQAFYIPAIQADAQPGLFPRDSAVFGPQAALTISDELLAWVSGTTGQPLPLIF